MSWVGDGGGGSGVRGGCDGEHQDPGESGGEDGPGSPWWWGDWRDPMTTSAAAEKSGGGGRREAIG